MSESKIIASEQSHFADRWMPEPNSGCWLWTGNQREGYGRFQIGRKGKAQSAHRVAWRLYRGEIPDGLCVLHRCDTPACVNPNHLFLGTKFDNNQDRAQKGRSNHPIGITNGRCKLTESQVAKIRSDTRSKTKIGSEYGISRTQVRRIKQLKAWSHL